MRARKIYLASSWRNENQPIVLEQLRAAGHQVYDFRNPQPGDQGFAWSSIDPNWKNWTPTDFKAALQHPIAAKGHGFDQAAMDWCDACVLLLPCGSSAHLEAGWIAGRQKRTCVYIPTTLREPELMYRSLALSDNEDIVFTEIADVLTFLASDRIQCAQCYFNGWRTLMPNTGVCPIPNCSSHRHPPMPWVPKPPHAAKVKLTPRLEPDENLSVTFWHGDAEWHDGAGVYYTEDEYEDEGSCGAFATLDEAVAHARLSYRVDP